MERNFTPMGPDGRYRVCLHESAGSSDPKRVAAYLDSKGYSVHIIVGPEEVIQMRPLSERATHATSINGKCIGVEIAHPYTPRGAPGERVAEGPFFWKGKYALPDPRTLVNLHRVFVENNLSTEFCSAITDRDSWSGVIPHAASPFDSHSDGWFPAAMIAGASSGKSYDEAVEDALRLVGATHRASGRPAPVASPEVYAYPIDEARPYGPRWAKIQRDPGLPKCSVTGAGITLIKQVCAAEAPIVAQRIAAIAMKESEGMIGRISNSQKGTDYGTLQALKSRSETLKWSLESRYARPVEHDISVISSYIPFARISFEDLLGYHTYPAFYRAYGPSVHNVVATGPGFTDIFKRQARKNITMADTWLRAGTDAIAIY